MPNTDKIIFLPQLQRYDQKIKGWADNKFLTKADTPSLPKATATTLGGVKVGNGLNVTSDGTLSNNIFIVSCDLNTSSATFEQINAAFTSGKTVLAVFDNGSVGRVSRIRNDLYTAYVNVSISSKTITSPSGNYDVPNEAHSQYVIWDKTSGYSVYSYNMSWSIGATLEYLKNGGLGKLDVKDSGITSAKLADGSVTAAKIADGAITADKIADGVVDAATDVRIAGKSITADGVADIPVASTTQEGVTKYDPYGGLLIADRGCGISPASKTQIDNRNASHFPIVADSQLDYAVKAAMCDGKGEAWTTEEQVAARERMGIGDHSLPKATATTLGGVKVGSGLSVTDDGALNAVSTEEWSIVEVSIGATSVTQEQYNTIAASWPNVIFKFNYKSGDSNELYLPSERAFDTQFIFSQVDYTQNLDLMIPQVTTITIHKDLSISKNTTNLKAATSTGNYGIMRADNTTLGCDNNGTISVKDGGITSAKIADGAITATKIASNIVGLGKASGPVTNGKIPLFDEFYIYLDGTDSNDSVVIYDLYDVGDFYYFILKTFISPSGTVVSYTAKESYPGITVGSSNTVISVEKPSSTFSSSLMGRPNGTSSFNSNGNVYKYSNESSWATTAGVYFAKSTSAQAALATLLPVQDECEQMAAEVAKLEKDWIDHPDETVAVDGNGVPITIATKKAELEKKQAELEKLREDYISKLGDWKNEVQE